MNITSDAKYACVKPECFYDTSRLAVTLIIAINTIVLNVHNIAQREANLEDECNRYQALEIGRHCEQKGDAHYDWSQYVKEYLIEGH